MTWYGFGTTSQMIPNQCWEVGWWFQTGYGVQYITVLSVIKGGFYFVSQLIILVMANQGILTFKNGYLITMDHWKPQFVSEDFGTSLDSYYSYINDDEEVTTKGDTNEEEHQVLPDFPAID